MMDDSIIMFRDYGEIVLDIKTIMDKKGLSITSVAKKTGLHHNVVRRYYERTAVRYDKDVLARLCFVIGCELQDIIYYRKPNKR